MSREKNYFLKKSLNEYGADYIKELTKQLLAADKKVTGELINSLNYKVVQTVDGLLLEIIAANYLKYVDEGTGPAAGHKQYWPNFGAIKKWAILKGFQPNKNKGYKTIDEVSWAICTKIHRDGIKPTHVLDKAKQSMLNNKGSLQKIVMGAKLDFEELVNEAIGNLKELTTTQSKIK